MSLGKKHLRKLLNAIQRGCLDGSNCTEQKVRTHMCSGNRCTYSVVTFCLGGCWLVQQMVGLPGMLSEGLQGTGTLPPSSVEVEALATLTESRYGPDGVVLREGTPQLHYFPRKTSTLSFHLGHHVGFVHAASRLRPFYSRFFPRLIVDPPQRPARRSK